MVVSRKFTNAETADLYRFRAQRSSGEEKRRCLHLAELYIQEDKLIAGSRHALDQSRQLLAKLKNVKF